MKLNEKRTTGRPNRATVNGVRNVLTASGKDSDFYYRFVNDTGDRIAQMQERGYEIVTDPNVKIGDRRIANPTQEGSPVQVSVGGGNKGYLMRIPKEWHEEDQAAKQKIVDETEQAMRKEAREGRYGKLEIGS